MEETRFTCTTCGSEFAKETVGDKCDLCYQAECSECLGKDGGCVPCRRD
jgi:hypothetical protein